MTPPRDWNDMARYSALLGRRVEVHYRAGDILLPASGTFVADSGRSIFLEQHLVQQGLERNFRWEIPYQYIVRLEELKDPPAVSAKGDTPPPNAAERQDPGTSTKDGKSRSTSTAAGASGDSSIFPLPRRPKIV
jgi:hypothetical protein